MLGMPDLAQSAQLVALFEGFRPCPYADPVNGIPTVGYGTTHYPNGTAVALNDHSVTPTTALIYLENDIGKTAARLWQFMQRQPTLNQWSAMVSLAYNVGVLAVAKSTLVKLFNEGHIAEAAEQFLLWDRAHVNGRLVEVQGLLNRRKAERSLFLQA